MPDVLYLIWAILPLALLWITVKAGTKTALNKGKREYPKSYLKELIFTTLAFIVSIFLDINVIGPDTEIGQTIRDFGVDPRLVRWLIFPAIVTGAALFQQYFIDKATKEAEAEKTARRKKYAPK